MPRTWTVDRTFGSAHADISLIRCWPSRPLLEAALKDVADVDPTFMPTRDKKAALRALDRASAQLDELRLRVTAAADDVAGQ